MDITDHQKIIVKDILNSGFVSDHDGYPVYTVSRFPKNYDIDNINKIYGYSFTYGDMWKNRYLEKSRMISIVWQNSTSGKFMQTDIIRMFIFVDRPRCRTWLKTEKKWIVDILNGISDDVKIRTEPYSVIYEKIIEEEFCGNISGLKIDCDVELGSFDMELGKHCDLDNQKPISLGYGFCEDHFLCGNTQKIGVHLNNDDVELKILILKNENGEGSNNKGHRVAKSDMAKKIYQLANDTKLEYAEVDYFQGMIYYGKFSKGWFTCIIDTNPYQPDIDIDIFTNRDDAWNNLGEFKEYVTQYYLKKTCCHKIIDYHSNLNKKLKNI